MLDRKSKPLVFNPPVAIGDCTHREERSLSSYKAGSLPMAEVLKWLTDAAENNTKIDVGRSCVTPFGIGTVQEHK